LRATVAGDTVARMTARAYLFVSKATIPWCIARYLSDDYSGNLERWRDLAPFGGEGADPTGAERHARVVENRSAATVALQSDPNPFLATNWTWVDTSGWWEIDARTRDPAARDEQKLAAMGAQAQQFLGALTDTGNTIQWAHVADRELALAWLDRAMKVRPGEIDALPPARQLEVITEMWGAFAQYWKALNVSVQSWAMYRRAWEFCARPANAWTCLKDGNNGVYWPRPFAAPIWARQTQATWYPGDAPRFLGPWRWEAILANEQWGAARTGHTRLDANLTVRFAAGVKTYLDGRWTDDGIGPWGQFRPGASDRDTQSKYYQCQDMMPYGGFLPASYATASEPLGRKPAGRCFAPMVGESHQFWLDASGMLSGGMNPVWPGVGYTAWRDLRLDVSSRAVRMLDPLGLARRTLEPSQLTIPGNANRRTKYVVCAIRMPENRPDVEQSHARFYVGGGIGWTMGTSAGDWTRTREHAAGRDEIKLAADIAAGIEAPRTSGEFTWRDGLLHSIPPGGNPAFGDGLSAEAGQQSLGGFAWATLRGAQSGGYGGVWARSVPSNVIGYSGYAQSYGDAPDRQQQFPLVCWQPPAKRYVDLLWPMLEYLKTKTPEEILYEVKLDTMGHNGYSLKALGNNVNAATPPATLDTAASSFSSQMQAARTAAETEMRAQVAERFKVVKLVTGMVGALTGAVVGAVATPVAGAAVGAGFNLLTGIIDAAADAQAREHAWVSAAANVFGVPDGIAGTGAWSGYLLGAYQRYALYNIKFSASSGAALSELTGMASAIYRNMRVRSRIPHNGDYYPEAYARWADGFVQPETDATGAPQDPYPVGYRPPFALAVYIPGVLQTLHPTTVPATQARRLKNLDPKPKPEARGAKIAVAAVAGIALGAAASEVTRG
jgi:hypothetical protein